MSQTYSQKKKKEREIHEAVYPQLFYILGDIESSR